MKLNLSLLTLLIWTIAGTLAPAQVQDPATGQMELRACLATLTGDDSASFEMAREFRVRQPGERTPSITVRLIGEQLDYFHCQNFTVSTAANGPGHDIVDSDGKIRRPLTYADIRGFRSFVSLDPYWALCHVSDNYTAFTYTVTDDKLGLFDRWEMVPLAAPSEKLYGVFQETLIVDPASHTVLSYSLLALDPDRVPLQDMRNDYEPERADAPSSIRVIQGRNDGKGIPVEYTVVYR